LLDDPQRRQLQLKTMRTIMLTRGFSLIELMIAISILVLLMVLAGPMYGEFIANTNIRNASDSILNGVRLAQAQAVRLNLPTEFQFNGTGWLVTTDDPEKSPGTPLQDSQTTYEQTEGATQAKITPTPVGTTTVTFGGLGRIISPNNDNDCSATLQTLDITNPNVTASRPLRVVITNDTCAVISKLCDPAVASSEPQACP
jgi:type IV fimbrial biogenesis protein FimT